MRAKKIFPNTKNFSKKIKNSKQNHLLTVTIKYNKLKGDMNTKNFGSEIIDLGPCLSRYAYSLTLDPDEAKDLVQETYFKALNNQEKFDNETNIKA